MMKGFVVSRIRTAVTEKYGGQTFYVSSLSQHNGEYTVKRFRVARGDGGEVRPDHTLTCNCPDFNHRSQVVGLFCKHIHLVKMLAKGLGGWTKVKRGLDASFGFGIEETVGTQTKVKKRRV